MVDISAIVLSAALSVLPLTLQPVAADGISPIVKKVAFDQIKPLAANCPQIYLDLQVGVRSAADGCKPYAAVDEGGSYSAGLAPTDQAGCAPSNVGQVYARNFTLDIWDDTTINGTLDELLFYAYYYPREQTTDAAASHASQWQTVVVYTSNNGTDGTTLVKHICMSQFTKEFPTYYGCYGANDFKLLDRKDVAGDQRPLVYYEHAGDDKARPHILTPVSAAKAAKVDADGLVYDYDLPPCVHWDHLPPVVTDTLNADPWKTPSGVTVPINDANLLLHAMAVMDATTTHVFLPAQDGGGIVGGSSKNRRRRRLF